MATAWSTTEIEVTGRRPFEMLRLELAGLPYVETEFNERVRRRLQVRTKAAVEYKSNWPSRNSKRSSARHVAGPLMQKFYSASRI
jgi:hypothetical protein